MYSSVPLVVSIPVIDGGDRGSIPHRGEKTTCNTLNVNVIFKKGIILKVFNCFFLL